MPISQGSAGGLPGVNLKAWAYVTAAGVLVRGFNVASVAKGVVGGYTVNFAAPMASAEFLMRCTMGSSGSADKADGVILLATTAAATLRVRTTRTGAEVDSAALWEFYE